MKSKESDLEALTMSFLDKWRKKGKFPFKLVIHVILAALITAEIIILSNSRGPHLRAVEDTLTHFFLPPDFQSPIENLAGHSQYNFIDSIDLIDFVNTTAHNFWDLQSTSVDVIEYATPDPPVLLSVEYWNDFVVSPSNTGRRIPSDTTTIDYLLTPDDPLGPLDVEPNDLHDVLATVRAMQLRCNLLFVDMGALIPACRNWTVTLQLPLQARGGEITAILDYDADFCSGMAPPSLHALTRSRLFWVNAFLLFFSLWYLLLCIKACIRSFKIYRRAVRVRKLKGSVHALSLAGRLRAAVRSRRAAAAAASQKGQHPNSAQPTFSQLRPSDSMDSIILDSELFDGDTSEQDRTPIASHRSDAVSFHVGTPPPAHLDLPFSSFTPSAKSEGVFFKLAGHSVPVPPTEDSPMLSSRRTAIAGGYGAVERQLTDLENTPRGGAGISANSAPAPASPPLSPASSDNPVKPEQSTATTKNTIRWSEMMQFFDKWLIMQFLTACFGICASTLALEIILNRSHFHASQDLLLGLCAFFTWVALLKYFEFAPQFYCLILSLKAGLPDIARFLAGTFPVFIGYALAGLIMFGSYSDYFVTFGESAVSLFSLLNGDSIHDTFNSLATPDKTLQAIGQIYLYTFIILFICAVLSIFIIIMGEGYRSADRDGQPMKSKVETLSRLLGRSEDRLDSPRKSPRASEPMLSPAAQKAAVNESLRRIDELVAKIRHLMPTDAPAEALDSLDQIAEFAAVLPLPSTLQRRELVTRAESSGSL